MLVEGCRYTLPRAISRLLFPDPNSLLLVVVRAAQVVPAMRADQLAFVAGEPVRTGGADLAVVVDRRLFGGPDGSRAGRTIL
jgi:hypothetical protein